jgi:SPP1 gp7 family putative phage head morphogenesis protein
VEGMRFKPAASPFKLSFDVPFAEAIKQSRSRKVTLPSIYYGEMQGVARMRAFSVAGIAATDQLQAILDSLNGALAGGKTFAEWKLDAFKEAGLVLPSHRLDNIFRTNIQSAYAAGRWEQQKRNLKTRPFLMYDAINDDRVRAAHLAMDGFVAKWDDPTWKVWYPPCGYRCRCSTTALTEEQAKKRMKPDQPASPGVRPDAGWEYDRREGATTGMKAAREGVRRRTKEKKLVEALEQVEKKADEWDTSTWKAIPGTQRGSNEGGLYEAPGGERFYVKFPRDFDQARGEVAAATLYKLMGVETVEPRLINIGGRNAIASKFRTDLKKVGAKELTDAAYAEDIAKVYQASILTKNWDAVGLDFDNLMISDTGRVFIVDTGASFYWRAQGARKAFGPDIEEAQSLLNASTNAQTARVFGEHFKRDVYLEQRGAYPAMNLTREQVEAEFRRVGFPEEEVANLTGAVIGRRDLILDRYDLLGTRTYPGFGKYVNEFQTAMPATRYEGGLKPFTTYGGGEPADAKFLPEFKQGLRHMEKALERDAFKGATQFARTVFNSGWSGSSSSRYAGALKVWASERFGVAVQYHDGNMGAAADAAARAHMKRVMDELPRGVTKEQMFRVFDIEYEYQQFMLRRLHGWETFHIYRGMDANEWSGFDGKKFTFNGVASTTTKQNGVFDRGHGVDATVYVEDFVKTWYQGSGYMHYGSHEAEYVILGRTRAATFRHASTGRKSPPLHYKPPPQGPKPAPVGPDYANNLDAATIGKLLDGKSAADAQTLANMGAGKKLAPAWEKLGPEQYAALKADLDALEAVGMKATYPNVWENFINGLEVTTAKVVAHLKKKLDEADGPMPSGWAPNVNDEFGKIMNALSDVSETAYPQAIKSKFATEMVTAMAAAKNGNPALLWEVKKKAAMIAKADVVLKRAQAIKAAQPPAGWKVDFSGEIAKLKASAHAEAKALAAEAESLMKQADDPAYKKQYAGVFKPLKAEAFKKLWEAMKALEYFEFLKKNGLG